MTGLGATDTHAAPKRRHAEGWEWQTMGGLVAAGHPETAGAAAAALAEGGNAVDAAHAGLCAACVAEPSSRFE